MKAARYTGGLCVGKFLNTVTTPRCSAEGDRLVAEHAAVVADAEFMYGYAVSSRLRLDPEYFEEALSWSE